MIRSLIIIQHNWDNCSLWQSKPQKLSWSKFSLFCNFWCWAVHLMPGWPHQPIPWPSTINITSLNAAILTSTFFLQNFKTELQTFSCCCFLAPLLGQNILTSFMSFYSQAINEICRKQIRFISTLISVFAGFNCTFLISGKK